VKRLFVDRPELVILALKERFGALSEAFRRG